jgi:hypothetical protein
MSTITKSIRNLEEYSNKHEQTIFENTGNIY